MFRSLCADDVCRLEAFGAFQQIKLHGFTLVERAVTVLLDGGEVHEYIFPRGALDESISLRPVEPLHCTFLSHGKNSFHNREEWFSGLIDRSPMIGDPLKEAGRTFSCASDVQKKRPQKENDSSALHRDTFAVRTSGARQFEAFPHTQQIFNSGLNAEPFPGIAEQIIRAIKSIRKIN